MKCSTGVKACAALFALLASAATAKPMKADDPATVDPAHFKVLLDNERVRVLDYRAAAGDKVPMHWHPDYITYDLSGGKSRFTYPKVRPVERTTKAGDVAWHMSETHAGENIGGAEIHVLLVELK
jgi:hypothetical protein